MGHILGAEVPALNSTGKTFTLGCAGNVYQLNVSEKIYFQLATNSESFTVVQAEFPQTATGFYTSFGEVASFRLGYTAGFLGASGNLNSVVAVGFYRFDLSYTVSFNFDNSHRDRNAIFSEDASHTHFATYKTDCHCYQPLSVINPG
ncbi:hypothetical protein C3B79_0772 [Aeromonas hydrophila]|nr:hypothetical protein C3B79_0772 [Aeromonas hydrophila]